MPLPYHRLRDDEDLDEEIERMTTKYGKEKGFSLRKAAFKLGGLREQLIKRHKSIVTRDGINAGPTGDDVHKDYEPRRVDASMEAEIREVVSDSP